MAGRPRAFATVDELQQGIDAYFDDCAANKITVVRGGTKIEVSEPCTVSGLADHLGVSRETVHTYASGEYGQEYSDAIKKATARIERDKVARAMLGFYDKTICIFDLKNNHGWIDEKRQKQNIEMTAGVYELSDEYLESVAAGRSQGATEAEAGEA